jgi:GMP synthase (glutamine-hydrolysing)
MILIISTCSQNLSENEFVRPIEKLLLKNGFDFKTKHYSEISDVSGYDKIIICGTALKDFQYLKDIGKFSWIKRYEGKLLGICAGVQIIATVFGVPLKEESQIGARKVNTLIANPLMEGRFNAYFLNSKQPILGKEVVPLTEDESVIKFEGKEFYGCMFHPEVLNPEIIINFCNL